MQFDTELTAVHKYIARVHGLLKMLNRESVEMLKPLLFVHPSNNGGQTITNAKHPALIRTLLDLLCAAN